jgi:hypothetical protein
MELEQIAREIFLFKGGKPIRTVPQYMVVEECEWLMFPTFSPIVTDGKEYRKQVYTYDEILELIKKYGLPQEWNKDGKYGPERYIEVRVWSDEPLSIYYRTTDGKEY